jgi:hypothetical protein
MLHVKRSATICRVLDLLLSGAFLLTLNIDGGGLSVQNVAFKEQRVMDVGG